MCDMGTSSGRGDRKALEADSKPVIQTKPMLDGHLLPLCVHTWRRCAHDEAADGFQILGDGRSPRPEEPGDSQAEKAEARRECCSKQRSRQALASPVSESWQPQPGHLVRHERQHRSHSIDRSTRACIADDKLTDDSITYYPQQASERAAQGGQDAGGPPPSRSMPAVILPVKCAETGAVVNVELVNPYQDDRSVRPNSYRGARTHPTQFAAGEPSF